MISLDTNVLVRYITQDEPRQAAAATRLIERECTGDSPGFINLIVVCELVWALLQGYRYKKPMAASVIRMILASSELLVERSELVWAALREYEQGAADFPDYLISAINLSEGVEVTYTFDMRAGRARGFKLLPRG